MFLDLSNVIDIWMKRFSETGQLLNSLYMELVKYDKVKIISDLIKFASFAEKSQTYIWTYIDYGIRVPIYRTLQWLSTSLPNGIKLTRDFLDELSIHILKEYTLMWGMILDFLYNYYKNNKDELIKYFRDELSLDITRDIDPESKKIPAIEDLKGVSAELKALYVLIDHKKPLLPFSIMQSPIIPSHIRPGRASGDLYLFEENLVVDIKTSNAIEDGFPTYYIGRRNLRDDLDGIGRLQHLYGIRKGIGVVADDGIFIRLAVYVPWRDIKSPLLDLSSPRLPLLIYVNNIGEKGVNPHKLEVRGDEVEIIITGYELGRDLTNRDVVFEEITNDDILLEFPKNGLLLHGEVERNPENRRALTIKFKSEQGKLRNIIMQAGEIKAIQARLVVYYTYQKQNEKNKNKVGYPVIALTSK
jgi:hypothetical protein